MTHPLRGHHLFGALLVCSVSLLGCGGSFETDAASGGTSNGTGGVSSTGGASTGGSTGTGGEKNTLPCLNSGSTLIENVRHVCKNGIWTPLNACVMAVNTASCCWASNAVRSEDVVSDPCLVAYPYFSTAGEPACADPMACDVACGVSPWPETRVAELNAAGECVAVDECDAHTDCVVATDHRGCCPCPDAFPRGMVDEEPCIGDRPPSGESCASCSGIQCEMCEPTPPVPLCIPNEMGVRACANMAYRGCAAQDALGLFPDPPPDEGPYGCIPPSYVWDGLRCTEFFGCLCEGADCDALFATPEQCLNAYAACGAACVPGLDQTCNHVMEMSSLAGTCREDGTCACAEGRTKDRYSGRCY